MKLTDKSREIFEYVKAHGKVSVDEMVKKFGRSSRSIGANVLDLRKKGLANRSTETIEGKEKPVIYVELTDEGKVFVESDEE